MLNHRRSHSNKPLLQSRKLIRLARFACSRQIDAQ